MPNQLMNAKSLCKVHKNTIPLYFTKEINKATF